MRHQGLVKSLLGEVADIHVKVLRKSVSGRLVERSIGRVDEMKNVEKGVHVMSGQSQRPELSLNRGNALVQRAQRARLVVKVVVVVVELGKKLEHQK